MAETTDDQGKAKHRSPAYPAITLKKAIDYARTFYESEKRHAAPPTVATNHWGFSEKSSGGALALGALMHFGLMSGEGAGPARRVKLTDLALRILLDDRADSPEKQAAIKQAALLPKIHAELYKKYGLPLPSDPTMRAYLILERDPAFNESVVGGFIKQFRDTLAFAKITSSDTLQDNGGDSDDTESDSRAEEEEVETPLSDSGKGGGGAKPTVRDLAPEGGEVERLRFNLKGGRRVRLFFSGHLPTQSDIVKLIANLELNKDTFPEDEE